MAKVKVTVNGVEIHHTGVEPYTKINGDETLLQCWSKQCEHPGCTNHMEFKTAGGHYGVPKEGDSLTFSNRKFLRKLCPTHYVRKDQDHAAGGRASARVSDADVAEMRRLAKEEGASPDGLAMFYPLTPGTIREILAGRRRACNEEG